MLRLATIKEIPLLNELIEQSVRNLCRDDYSPEEIDAAICHVFGVDSELVHDQTYFVIESNGVIQACGGWSKRKTLFGGSQFSARETGYLDPKTDAAKIRAFFVHPEHTRKGLGTLLLKHSEEQALAHGFSKTEMMATLSGVKLYQVRGYMCTSEKVHQLSNAVTLRFMHMNKNLLECRDVNSITLHSKLTPSLQTPRRFGFFPIAAAVSVTAIGVGVGLEMYRRYYSL